MTEYLKKISIHAPHARSDTKMEQEDVGKVIFQSTLLMRGATPPSCLHLSGLDDFNPRSSCEERRVRRRPQVGRQSISIHAPHARSDILKSLMHTRRLNFNPRSSCEERQGRVWTFYDDVLFQSTLLMRGATHRGQGLPRRGHISIHAPHARSDYKQHKPKYVSHIISIHAPHARSD